MWIPVHAERVENIKRLILLEEIFVIQCPNNKRDRDTLETLILDHVAQGSTIYTDGWAAYRNLETHVYSWDYVNQSGKSTKY